MGQLFIYIFIGLGVVSFISFYVFKALYVDESSQEENFSVVDTNEIDTDIIPPAPRPHVAYEEQQAGIFVTAIKKAPKTIMTTLLIQLGLMIFAGYLSVTNIHRLSMAGSALIEGNYGLVVSSLWPIGKDAVVEQTRLVRGVHKYLNENGLYNFIYIGQKDGKNYAVMESLYSAQDHDEKLLESDESYGTIIVGLSVDEAKDICDDKYEEQNGQLLSLEAWQLSRSHYFAAKNVKAHPDIPEWTREKHKSDQDDYLVIGKDSGVKEYAEKEDIDREEGGLYIDGDDLETAAFRCEITW